MISEWVMKISELANDTEWDSFVASTPGGHHVQTSCWARIKSLLGWKAKRIIVWKGSEIIGGAQILIRSVPIVGNLGYVTKGPILTNEDPEISEGLLEGILKLSKQNNCQLIAIQPPNNGNYLIKKIQENKFSLSTLELAPTASIILDLNQSPESLFGRFHHKTRQNIRISERAGIVVTEGNREDMNIFYSLHLSTAQRQKFIPYKQEYFHLLWDNLSPNGWIHLFLAWHKGEPISALLIVPFGNTIITKMSGWTGEHQEIRSNEALHWAAIKWAIEHGYQYFDLEGINPESARLLLLGEKPALNQDSFKYGFDGIPILYPPAYDYIPNPIINRIYRRIPPGMHGDSLVSRMLERFRKR